MEIIPSQIIGFRFPPGNGEIFFGYNPNTESVLETAFHEASGQDIREAVDLAHFAFSSYRNTSAENKSLFLETIAANIEALGDELLGIIHDETALPLARLTGERSRTVGQLRLFAKLLKDGNWNRVIRDEALPDRKPIPRPEMLQMQKPIGVVVVFGSSNFPLAFSVAGGDTTAALAAGCPVIFKAHPAHPATSQLIGRAIAEAAKKTGMPDGVFSMLHGFSHEIGGSLVTHPLVKAVAFTGSFRGGKSLYDLAARRKEPIPVYAEMGSVNPVFFLPDAVKTGGDSLATQFAQSVTLGTGQFCTNPGLSVFLNNEESKTFITKVAAAVSAINLHPFLTSAIAGAYQAGLEKQKKLPGASTVSEVAGNNIVSHISMVSAKNVIGHPEYFEELFGPSTIAVIADNVEELKKIIEIMPGQLTATIQAAEKDYPLATILIDELTQKAGRLVMNGFPTGVEVCHSMVHGGPFPATTDSRVTSVGTTSIYRFTRPVCYQNIPEVLIPGIGS